MVFSFLHSVNMFVVSVTFDVDHPLRLMDVMLLIRPNIPLKEVALLIPNPERSRLVNDVQSRKVLIHVSMLGAYIPFIFILVHFVNPLNVLLISISFGAFHLLISKLVMPLQYANIPLN